MDVRTKRLLRAKLQQTNRARLIASRRPGRKVNGGFQRSGRNGYYKSQPNGGPRGNYGPNQGGKDALELKDVEATLNVEASTVGSITLVNGVAQGTDFTNRIGRRMNIKSVLVRGFATVGATATSGTYRWLLVWDRQPNAVACVITDVLSATSTLGVQNLTNRERFVVLADKTGWVESTQATQKPIKKYLKCNLETTNGGTAATIGSIQTGALWFITVGTVATGVTSPLINVTVRVRYTD